MEKADAYKILGLTENSSRTEVEKRYTVYLRRMKNTPKEELDFDFNEITAAYNLLMGYIVEEDESEKKAPNPFLMKLGIDSNKLSNNLYYFKWHIIIGIISLVVIVSTVYGCVTRVDPDFYLVVMGDIYLEDSDTLESAVLPELEGAQAMAVENLYLSGSQEQVDPTVYSAMLQKASVLIAAGDIDVFIVDQANFDRYVDQGGYYRLDEFLPQYKVDEQRLLLAQVEGYDESPYVYGIDVSDSTFFEENRMFGRKMILTISARVKNMEYAQELFQMILDGLPAE